MSLRLVLAASLAGPLAACGSGVDGAESTVDVAEAAAKTASARSARVSYSMKIEGGPEDGASMVGEGEFGGGRGRIILDMSGVLPAHRELTETHAEMIFDGETVYVREPLPGTRDLAEGKSWFKFTEKGTDDFLTFSLGDPSSLLRDLGEAADFEEVGHEEVRSLETTHFQGTLDSEEIDVWVGEDGLLRRVRFEGPIPTGEDGRETTTMDFYDFGADIDIELPPADEVAEHSTDVLSGGSD